ncbi:MAG: alpha/beta hydrolase fold domain-containing protein [Devosia sp.]
MGLWLDSSSSGRPQGVITTDLSEEMDRANLLIGTQSDGSVLELGRARAWMEGLGKVVAAHGLWPEVQPTDETIELDIGSVPIRTYNPDSNEMTVVFIHGGGWVFGSLDTHDVVARWLAAETGARVVSIGYSLAPEHPFPRAVSECAGVIRKLIAAQRGQGSKLYVCGDSAGANIGAMSILRLEKDDRAAINGFISVYGVYSPDLNLSSHKLYGDGRFGLSELQMRWFWNLYAPHLSPFERDQLTPLNADLTDFPPTLCVGTECDLLLDDTLAFYSRLAGAQVDVSLSLWPSLAHGCLVFVGSVESVTLAASSIINFIEAQSRLSEGPARSILTPVAPRPGASIPSAAATALRSHGPLLDVEALFLTSRSRLHGSVSHAIARDIITGKLRPGGLMPSEDKASASFGVSRSAYREAIRTLAAKGLVTASPKIGTRIAPRADWHLLDPDVLAWHFEAGPTEVLINNLFELRATIESNAVALAATRRDEANVSKLTDSLARMARSSPYSGAWLNAVIAFHQSILLASKNDVFVAIWPVINTTVRWSVKLQMMLPTLELLQDPVADYTKVFENITSQNAKGAHQAMAQLIDASRVDTLANFERVQMASPRSNPDIVDLDDLAEQNLEGTHGRE